VALLKCDAVLNRAIKMNLANEGLEARKKEEEVSTRKRKAEEDKQWEGSFLLLRPISGPLTIVANMQRPVNNGLTHGGLSQITERRRRKLRPPCWGDNDFFGCLDPDITRTHHLYHYF
jgi:hypothetical protein